MRPLRGVYLSRQSAEVAHGDLYPEQRRAEWLGEPLALTSTEFSLLEVLLRHLGHPVSKAVLTADGRPLIRCIARDTNFSRNRPRGAPCASYPDHIAWRPTPPSTLGNKVQIYPDLVHSPADGQVKRESGEAMLTVTEALKRRISIREFRPQPLPKELVREILDVARWAPSGGNLQPWKVIAVTGAERAAVIELAIRTHAAQGPDESTDRPVYPPNLWEPYRTRRYKLGEDMYALLKIPRSDRAGRLARFERNYEMFSAPVELFFVIDERMGHGQWAHLGMFMQSIALAALERGVGSCMQEAWATLRRSLKTHFALDEHEMIYCGMALGYADETAAVNSLRSDRAPVEEIASLRGFE